MHDNAIARIRELFGHARDPRTEMRLVQEATKIEGSESVFRRIVKANSVDEVLDCTTEIRYALAFDNRLFKVKFMLPGAEAKPDLLVSRGDDSAYVEIRRIRPDQRSLPVSSADVLPQYGGEVDLRKIEQELRGKFRQVLAVSGSNSIIATWSDRDFVEEVDFEQAVRNIRRSPTDPVDGRPIPGNLLFCIFGWSWTDCGTGQQLYCEPLRRLTEPFITWMEELEQVRIAF
jgi:hypothetical protein